MPFLLLLLLTVACLPVKWPTPPDWVESFGSLVLSILGIDAADRGAFLGSTVLTWLGVALVTAMALSWTWHLRFRLAHQPERRNRFLHEHAAWRFYHLIGLFLVYGCALYVLGWGWAAQGGATKGSPESPSVLGSELFILAPFLVGLVLAWAIFYDAERALHDASPAAATPYWSRGACILFHARQNLALVFIPVLLLLTVNGLPRLLPEQEDGSQLLAGGITTVAALLVFVCMPWTIRLVLGLKPMPKGPLRDRLLGAAQRLHFRCSNILMWNTRGGVANAMVVGIVPFLRYVVLTDRLVSEMTPSEVEAVFGHEIGHIKHRHMIYYLAFLLLSLGVLAELEMVIREKANWQALPDLSSRQDLAVLPMVASLGAYIFLVFGFLSRRCERQADIFGCRAVSCAQRDCIGHEDSVALTPRGHGLCATGIHTFINALEKVAYLNGISRDRPGWLQSWQHSTIARRVAFLQRVLVDPTVESRFQRAVGFVKWGLFLGLGTLLLFLGVTWGWDALTPFPISGPQAPVNAPDTGARTDLSE